MIPITCKIPYACYVWLIYCYDHFYSYFTQMVERAESYVESVKDLPQLHLGPFLCLYGINQHDPKHNFDLTLGKHLHQIHQRLDPREPKIEELKQIFSKLEVRKIHFTSLQYVQLVLCMCMESLLCSVSADIVRIKRL